MKKALWHVQANITVIRRRKFEPANTEFLFLGVNGNNAVYFMFCACHRSPGKYKLAVFLTSLATTLELIYNLRREIVVIGNLNFDLFSDPATTLRNLRNRVISSS